MKNPVKMVVVGCLFLCSKFAKNCLSAGVCSHPLRNLTALPRLRSWIMVEERGNGRWKGRRGRVGKGEERAGEKEAGGNGEEGVSPSEWKSWLWPCCIPTYAVPIPTLCSSPYHLIPIVVLQKTIQHTFHTLRLRIWDVVEYYVFNHFGSRRVWTTQHLVVPVWYY